MPVRLFLPLAGLMVAALVAPASVVAQQLRFDQKKYDAVPGETVEVRLMAEGAGDLSGLNFTLRIAEEDTSRARLMDATSFTTFSFNQYRYADHRLRRAAVETGVLTGDVAELRGVLYSHLSTPASFSTDEPRHVASVFIPIDLHARGRVVMEIAEGADRGVHLIGMATPEGNAVANVRGDFATLVIRRSGEPMVTDFRQPRAWPGWEYVSSWPQSGDPHPIGETVPGEGLTVRSTMEDSFGEWRWDFINGGPWLTPRAGSLLVTDWLISSTHTGADNPGLRLRHLTHNSMNAGEVVITDLDGNPSGVEISPVPDGRIYRTIVEIPDFAASGSVWDGINPFFDMISLGDVGTRPGRLALARMTERIFDPAALRDRRTEYYQVFSTRESGSWWFDSGLTGGREVTYTRGRNGLGITSGGPLIEDPDAPYGFRFSAGVWIAPFEVVNVHVDSSRWYRVEAEFISTASNPANSPAMRVRAFPQGNELFFMAQHYPGVDLAGFHVERASLDPATVNLWFQVPELYHGHPLTLAFDIMHTEGVETGEDSTPTVYLKWIRLTSYDKPELRPEPTD